MLKERATALDLREMQQHMSWLRESHPSTIVEQTAEALRDGASENALWAAGALTAARYINNQAHNLLGFVSHAAIGCEDARQLAENQPDRTRHLLLIQALHQVLFDMHDPCLSPYELLPFSPLYDRSDADNIRWLRADVRLGEYMRVDHRIVGLKARLPRPALVDLLLDIGLEGVVTDDHTFLTPALSLHMVDLIGWDEGFDLLRVALRYSASFPRNFAPYDRALDLIKHYRLEDGAAQTAYQPDNVDHLRAAFLSAPPHDRPEIAARALAEGCSPDTVLAAVCLAACDLYLMTDPVPHDAFDAISREVAPMHINTSTSALRTMLPRLSPRTAALAAIQGGSLLERGPSILNEAFEFVPFEPARSYPYAEDVDALRRRSPEALLDIMHQALHDHDTRTATAAVRAYEQTGSAPDKLIAALTAVACTDDGTLLHSVKHMGALLREFRLCAHADRWNYLIAAARFMAWYAGKNTSVYQRALAALDPA
jgi:hypothetical protein